MILPPPCFTVGIGDEWCLVSSRHAIWHSGQRCLFHQSRESWSPLGTFWQNPGELPCAFYWGIASIWPLCHCLISRVLQKWLSLWKVVLSPQSNARALSEWPSGSWSPPWLVRRRALGRVLLVYKLLPFRDEAAEFTGTSTPWYNPVIEISRQFTGLTVCRILRWKVNLIHFGVRLWNDKIWHK